MLFADTQQAASTDWSQFGLAGAVIGVLFFVLFQLGKEGLKKFELLAQLHKQERGEWINAFEKQTDKLNDSIKELARTLARHPPSGGPDRGQH